MNAWKVILAALVIYAAGVVTGTFVPDLSKPDRSPREARQGPRPRPPVMTDLVRRMESRLELSESQQQQVKDIVEASQERMRSLMDEMRPRFESESQSMRLEIEAILNEDQMATFDRIFEHRGKRNGRGPGGRGPGGRGGMRGPGGHGPGGPRGEGRLGRDHDTDPRPEGAERPRRPQRPEGEPIAAPTNPDA